METYLQLKSFSLHKRSHDNAKKGLAAALAVGLLSRDRAVAAVLDDC